MIVKQKLAVLALACLLFNVPAETLANTPTTVQQTTTVFTEVLLSIDINGQPTGDVVIVLQDNQARFLISSADLQRWHFRLPHSKTAIFYHGQSYYRLTYLRGVTYQFHPAQMTLSIHAPSQTFVANLYDMNTKLVNPEPSNPGGFLNYDLLTQHTVDNTQTNGLFELGIFNRYGVGTTNWLVQQNRIPDNNSGTTAFVDEPSTQNNTNKVVRLESVWTKDDPATMHTLRVGDTVSQTGMWGGAIGFGGIQYATNFATQPSLITNPLPSASGAAIVPTAINLYVNNTLLDQKNIQPGPFNINNIPVINGAGILSVVTTDVLGREQIINMPYYTSSNLLQPGLHNFSYEAGFIRNNFTMDSADYGRFLMSGTDTFGVTNNLTGQWHAEALRNQQTLGGGGYLLWHNALVLNASLAASHSNNGGIGGLALLGVQQQTLNQLNLGANLQVTTRPFVDVGIATGQYAPSLQTQAFIGVPLPKNTAVGLSYTRQNNRGTIPNASLLNASYQKTLMPNLSLSVSAITNIGGQNNKTIYLVLSQGFGNNLTATASLNQQTSAAPQTMWDVNQALPAGVGYGYDIQTTQGPQENYQATITAQNSIGTYAAAVSHPAGQQNAYRFEAQGGIAVLDNKFYLSRQINNSFAVVELPGYSNVGVYSFNQLAGTTNKNGDLLVPDILAYQANDLRIEPNDLPMDTEIGATQLQPIPYYRAGVLARFPVKPAHSATFKLVDEQGKLLTADTVVSYVDVHQSEQQFIVADNGEVYVTGLALHNLMQASVDGHICQFIVDYPEHTEPMPDLGVFVCKLSAEKQLH